MSSQKSAIRLSNVYKTFRKGQDRVLHGINLEFADGLLTYILGSSGAGKSVMLKHILGLMTPDSGEIWVFDQEITRLVAVRDFGFRSVFGMLFQNAALFDDLTVYENVAFPLWEHTNLSDEEIKVKVHSTLALLGMKDGFDKYPNELSGGMRKRVGLARAIIKEPRILLYDEPTTGLDPVTRKTVDELIETLKERLKLTSIVISHDIPSAMRLADRIAFLAEGRIVFHGTPEEFAKDQHPAIQAFLESEKTSFFALKNGLLL